MTRMCTPALAVLCVFALAASVRAQSIASQLVVQGLSRPVFVCSPPGDNDRLFIIEQRLTGGNPTTARIRIFNKATNTLLATPYLTITGLAGGSEQGLLGLAFHPDFADNGYFYVYYNQTPVPGVSRGTDTLARYRATGGLASSNTADAASGLILMTALKPDSNHNGGWIAFGPDGYLYVAMGDGGCGNDSNCGGNTPSIVPPGHTPGTGNAQDITDNLLGKIQRLDVDGPDNIPGNDDDADPGTGKPYRCPPDNPFVGVTGDDEIWAYGLRNPWRDSFDRATGDLWIGDVGQNVREEIDFQAAGTPGGRNYGWRCMEGFRCTGLSGCACNAGTLTLPVRDYEHTEQNQACAVTGGYVYRGCAIASLYGSYIHADYCSGQFWTFELVNGVVTNLADRTGELHTAVGGQSVDNPTSFGEDNRGELYITDEAGGQVFRIIAGTAQPDCNANGTPDACDIAGGASQDANHNGVPDECENNCAPCVADFNNSGGTPDDADISAFFAAWNDGAACADANSSGGTPDDADVTVFFTLWNDGGC